MRVIKIHDNRNDDDEPVFESTDEQEIIDWFDNVYPEFREFYETEYVDIDLPYNLHSNDGNRD